ncbi:restriction endonuclease subunit S [Algibacter sp. L3A6]|uniref:restriction endonuclease subunit S n=1 Tax=Algibacter sp. L3A6 TaxID=2686366 RepID=UPI00131DED7B|nr:restriction endonuclease subunit S [Algibacter sp. L3A6]
MMQGWKEVELQDISTKIGDGLHGTPKYDENGGYFFINGNNLVNGKILIKPETKKLNEKEYLKIKKELNDKTILVGINGTLGNIGFYNGEPIALGKSACYINLNNEVDKNYIRYTLEGQHFQKYAYLFATGSTIKNLGLKAVRKYKINLPPLKTQRKIASILSGYDDLIENNLKRIKLLEEQAQQTYEEWFVRFKFPGYENVDIDAESGLPVGWEKNPLKSFCNKITKGTTPTSLGRKFVDEGVNFVKAESYSDDGFFITEKFAHIDDDTHETLGRSKLQENDVLVSIAGVLGRIGMVNNNILPANTNQAVGIVRISESSISPFFIKYFLSSEYMNKLINTISGQAAQPNINLSQLGSLRVLTPNTETINKFHKMVKLGNKMQLKLIEQNQHLKEARDILLPRLMSGMIDVDGLEVGEQLGMVAEESEKYNKV